MTFGNNINLAKGGGAWVANIGNRNRKTQRNLSFLLVYFNHKVYKTPAFYVPILEAAKRCRNLSHLGLSLSPGRLEQVCLDLLNPLRSLVTLREDLEHCMRYFMLWHQ